MISNMASCIVDALIRNKEIDIQSTSVYQYGFEIFISSVLTILITIIVLLIFRFMPLEQFEELHICSIIFSILVTAHYAPVESENKPLSANQKKTLHILGTTAATKSGYSVVTYRFKGNGTLYKGTSQYSGVLWSDSKTY